MPGSKQQNTLPRYKPHLIVKSVLLIFSACSPLPLINPLNTKAVSVPTTDASAPNCQYSNAQRERWLSQFIHRHFDAHANCIRTWIELMPTDQNPTLGLGCVQNQIFYRTIWDEKCLEVAFLIHLSYIGNYLAGTVVEFDRNGLLK
jgi:hypothetical protein